MPLVKLPYNVNPNSGEYSDAMKLVMTAISRYSSRYPNRWHTILTDQGRIGAMKNYLWAKELVQKGKLHDCGIAIGDVTRKLDGVFRYD